MSSLVSEYKPLVFADDGFSIDALQTLNVSDMQSMVQGVSRRNDRNRSASAA